MIKVRVLRDGQNVEDLAMAELPAVRAEAGTLIWVEVISPTPAELLTAELGGRLPAAPGRLRTEGGRP